MKLEFFYDIVCPYAYIASQRLEKLRVAVDPADIAFTPVLLGGIYELTKAPQGKAGSATDVQVAPKSKVLTRDFARTLARFNIELSWHPKHPVRSLEALRLLHSVKDQTVRKNLTHALFKAYWVDNLDIADKQILVRLAQQFNVKVDTSIWSNKQVAESLSVATARVVQLGAPGVPFFHLPRTVSGEPISYWGGDRLHFVESQLAWLSYQESHPDAEVFPPPLAQPRVIPDSSFPLTRERVLVFFWDFSSPWSYMGWRIVKDRLKPLCGDKLTIVSVPILVGGLFQQLGTGNILTLPPVKQAYGAKDMQDWITHWNALPPSLPSHPTPHEISLTWPDAFPIRSILPARVAILHPETTDCLFSASWSYNEDVASPQGLQHVLVEDGKWSDDTAGDMVLQAGENAHAKKELWDNLAWAQKVGVFGVPSFIVCECAGKGVRGNCSCEDVVWGQDRLMDVVAELLAGSGVGAVRGNGKKQRAESGSKL